jgi:hypothetical protein
MIYSFMHTLSTHSCGLLIARDIENLNKKTDEFYKGRPFLGDESPWVEGAKKICFEYNLTPEEFVGISREVLK